MLASKMLLSTLKEAPQEAKIDSHVLLLRAAYVKSLVAGVYSFLPLGLRSLKKIENIIREEMDLAGANELLCSALQPRELWDESKRWDKYGPNLFSLTDRNEREFCLGPTHEEVFTDLARQLIKSPKNLPMNLYQFQSKFRDEMRPRFGLIRSREFLMKDAYSFDKDEAGLDLSYQIMYQTYERIFERLGLKYRAVLADTGSIGGDGSHQFMALSNVGESTIIYCPNCDYAADQEKAELRVDSFKYDEELKEIEQVFTPNIKTIDQLVDFLKIDSRELVKALVYKNQENEEFVIGLIRGDRELNEVKLASIAEIDEDYIVMATDKEIEKLGLINGFVGPVGLNDIKIFIDEEVALMKNVYVGGNVLDYHLKNVNYQRDFDGVVTNLKLAGEGDLCPICGEKMLSDRGIEVGQVFKLQTKYSAAMNCNYQNEDGKNVPMYMGCYGIGVSRTLQSIIEQYNDEFGIKMPVNVAPYEAVVIPINNKIEEQFALANNIYQELKKRGIEVILDDRDAKAGFKFKDFELIGIPYMIVCGKKTEEGIVELKNRMTLEKIEMNYQEAINFVVDEIFSKR